MLRYLKERMMPAIPEKTFAERSLETIEQGLKDRQSRQQAEADARAEAEHAQRLQVYRTKQDVAKELVARYGQEAHAFDAALGELSEIVERLSHMTRAIGAERDWLSQESRELGDFTAILPHEVCDVFVEARRVLGHAWSRGQTT